MSNIDTLFETAKDRNVAHVDAVLAYPSAGPWPLQADERAFLRVLKQHIGLDNAIPLAEVAEQLRAKLSLSLTEDDQKKFRLTADRIKEMVRELRLNFHVQVGASRDAEGGGYYLIATAEELELSCRPMENQALTMLKVVAAMRGRHYVAELLGQLRLELAPEAVPDATGDGNKFNKEAQHGRSL